MPNEAPAPPESAPPAERAGDVGPARDAEAEGRAAEAAPPATAAPALGPVPLLFGKWDLRDVRVSDPGLRRYINLGMVYMPHTNARHASRPFGKARVTIVERLVNCLMRSEDYTGKKSKAYRAVREALDLVHERTKRNPVQVLVEALEHAAPREEVTRLRYGGISVPKAVDVSPSRRLDVALRNIASGATQASFKSPRPIHECLATEIIRASRREMESFAVAKKEEVERVAKSAR